MDNPEFRRQLWLELSPPRVVAVPLLLGLVFALVALTLGFGAVARPAFWILSAVLLLWGTRLAADAVADEVRGRTWDAQRMSALPPWRLAWGKLFGAPVVTWYTAALCAAAYLAAAGEPWPERVSNLLLVTATAVLLHAVALVAVLQGLRKRRALHERLLGLLPVAGFALIPLLRIALTDVARSRPLGFFGFELSLFGAVLLSLGAFALWAVIGVHRLLRAELQLRNPPVAWLAFLAFAMAWAAGFVGAEQRLAEGRVGAWRLAVAYAVGLAGVYAALFAESKQPIVFRRLFEFRRSGQRERLLDELPLWAVTLPVVAALGVLLLLQPGTPRGLSAEEKQVAAGLFLLVLRDVGLVLGLNFARDARRADVSAFAWLLVLYGVAPGLAAVLGTEGLTVFLRPRADVAAWQSLLPLALGAVAAWAFARARWRRVAAGWPKPPTATRAEAGP